MATIELHRVEKKFGEVFAVKPMSLTVNNGEFVALLGPSGCGKTTTLRMMSGLETVSAGKITLIEGDDMITVRGNRQFEHELIIWIAERRPPQVIDLMCNA